MVCKIQSDLLKNTIEILNQTAFSSHDNMIQPRLRSATNRFREKNEHTKELDEQKEDSDNVGEDIKEDTPNDESTKNEENKNDKDN